MIRNSASVCISRAVHDNDGVQSDGKYCARNNLNIVLVLAPCLCIPRCSAKDLLHMEKVVGSPWHHWRNFITNSPLRGQEWRGRLRVKNSYTAFVICLETKQNAVSCSAASSCRSTTLKFLIDDAHHQGGRGRQWIDSWFLHLSSLFVFSLRWRRSCWRLRMRQWWKSLIWRSCSSTKTRSCKSYGWACSCWCCWGGFRYTSMPV